MTRPARQERKARNRIVSACGLLSAVQTACFLLVLASVGLTPGTARTQDTLASTLGVAQTGGTTANNGPAAQGFTTGPATNGYNISSVVLAIGSVSSADPSSLRVTIRADNGGIPGASVAELTRTSDLVANSENEFLPQGDVHLDQDTRYWIRFDWAGQAVFTVWTWGEAAGVSNFGWDIEIPAKSRDRHNDPANQWTDLQRRFRVAINGTVADPPPTPQPPGTPAVDSRTRALQYNLASIGRAVTATAVDHIWDRAARLEPGVDTTLAMVGGRILDTGALESRDVQRVRGAIADALGVAGASVQDGAAEIDLAHALLPDARTLVDQTRFALALNGSSGPVGAAAFWGRGDFTAFEGEGGDAFPGFATEGEVVSGHVGFDYRTSPQVLVGAAVGHSRGETSHSFTSDGDRDKLETELLSVYPYLYWTPPGSSRIWWGMVGHGTGEATLTEGSTRATTDIAQRTFAGGVREVSRLDVLEVAVKADAFLTEIVADAVSAGPIALGETEARASRVRAALEGTRTWALEGDASLAGTVELGLRVDSRDAASGKGADIAGELHYADPGNGLAATLQGSTLLAHEADGFGEWGVGLLVVYDPGVHGEGMQLTLNPSWNTPRSGVAAAAWNADTSASERGTVSDRGAALGVRLGYGTGVLRDRVRMTVYGEAGSDADASRLRLGTDLRPTGSDRFGLQVYGERADRRAGDETTLGLQLGLVF